MAQYIVGAMLADGAVLDLTDTVRAAHGIDLIHWLPCP